MVIKTKGKRVDNMIVKDSAVAVFDGHPLDIQSKTKYVIINGEVVFQG